MQNYASSSSSRNFSSLSGSSSLSLMAEYERRLKLAKDEFHRKYDHYDDNPKSHKHYNYWWCKFQRIDGYKSNWGKYWMDRMDEEYQEKLDDFKQKLIEELQQKNRVPEREERDEEQRRQAPMIMAPSKQHPVMPSIQIKQEPMDDEENNPLARALAIDHRRTNGHSLSVSQQTLLVDQTDQLTQTENEPSIPLSQVQEIILNFGKQVRMAVTRAENEFMFRNGFAQKKGAFVIQPDPTRGCQFLPDKGDKLLKIQMAANKFIISHSLRSQAEAIKDEIRSIESRWEKLLPRGVQLQLSPSTKRRNDDEAGNKYPKRNKLMEPPEARGGSWLDRTPGPSAQASPRMITPAAAPKALGNPLFRFNSIIERRSSVFVEPPKKPPPARRMTICEKKELTINDNKKESHPRRYFK